MQQDPDTWTCHSKVGPMTIRADTVSQHNQLITKLAQFYTPKPQLC